MKVFVVLLSCFLSSFASGAPTSSDIALAQKHAVSDLLLSQKSVPNFNFANWQSASHDECEAGGAGSAACWKACKNEGYPTSTCAPRCGVSTSNGSELCWKACKSEGYPTSTCAPRCGISTSSGSKLCWTACKAEGYSSSTCASRCGTETEGGSALCWEACTNEGYSSSACASRCGNH